MADHVLIGGLVFAPQRALGDVAHLELPVLCRLFQPGKKAFALLLLGDMQEEFQDHGAVAREIALDRGNILKAVAPDVFGDELWRNFLFGEDFRMHAHHQAFLVMGAIEDADAAALRQRDQAAPEEIVVELE